MLMRLIKGINAHEDGSNERRLCASDQEHRFCGHVRRIFHYARPLRPPQCGTIDSGSYVNLTERNLQDAQKFLLMHEVVQPVDPVPYFMEDSVRFTHVAVDVVQGKDVLFHIIFLATGTGPPRHLDSFQWKIVLKRLFWFF